MSLIVIAGLVSVALVAALFFFSRESPGSAGGKFMDALVRGDAKSLAEVSYLRGENRDRIEQEWNRSLAVSRYYNFAWEITAHKALGPDRAAVMMEVVRNAASQAAFPETYQIELVRIGGRWLVDVPKLPRSLYPFLPR